MQTTEELICEYLASSALADHLGDVRDAEDYLWQALGVSLSELRDARFEANYDAFGTVRELAARINLPFPDYVHEDN